MVFDKHAVNTGIWQQEQNRLFPTRWPSLPPVGLVSSGGPDLGSCGKPPSAARSPGAGGPCSPCSGVPSPAVRLQDPTRIPLPPPELKHIPPAAKSPPRALLWLQVKARGRTVTPTALQSGSRCDAWGLWPPCPWKATPASFGAAVKATFPRVAPRLTDPETAHPPLSCFSSGGLVTYASSLSLCVTASPAAPQTRGLSTHTGPSTRQVRGLEQAGCPFRRQSGSGPPGVEVGGLAPLSSGHLDNSRQKHASPCAQECHFREFVLRRHGERGQK